jgi:hypothetical protein
METRAYFMDIQSHLIDELASARSEIVIAVPWFTDRQLFDLICRQSRKGMRVQLLLMQDEINRTGRIPFQLLESIGGQVFWVPEGGRLMHNKFVVIDQQTVIIGSYNWSNKAQSNDENITIITGNLALAAQYIETYQNLVRGLGYQVSLKSSLDPRSISLRLQTIRNLIELEEIETLTGQVRKLAPFDGDSELHEIIGAISDRLFDKAKERIIHYLERHQQIAVYVDHELAQLEILLEALKIQLNSLSDQKAEMERQILTFDLRTTEELGELINEYLRLRSEKLRKAAEEASDTAFEEEDDAAKTEYQHAKQEYENYREEYERAKDEPSLQLDEEEQKRLKSLYRKASQICHPDKVDKAHQQEAHEAFVALNEAYRKNDIQAIESILKKLEIGQFDLYSHGAIKDRVQLEEQISELRSQIELLTRELVKISKSENYRLATTVSDINEYLEKQRIRLREEIEQLRTEMYVEVQF